MLSVECTDINIYNYMASHQSVMEILSNTFLFFNNIKSFAGFIVLNHG